MSLEQLMSNPYAWAFLALCTVSSVIIAVWSHIKNKKILEVSCYSIDNEIVSDGKSFISELQVLFCGKTVDKITVTRFAVWNSGTEVLNHADIVDTKPMRIKCDKDSEILDAMIIKQTDETNRFMIKKASNYIELQFDYLNKQDGAIIQIVHTGEHSSLIFDCKIKGGNEPKNLNVKKKQKNEKQRKNERRSILVILLLLSVVVVAMSITMILVEWDIIPKEILFLRTLFPSFFSEASKYINSGVFVISILVLIFFNWSMIKSLYHINIPQKLRSNIEFEYS